MLCVGIKMKIRKATQNDADAIRSVHVAAFPEGERDLISDVAVAMLFEEASPPVLSLVAEVEDTIIGHVTFSPVTSRDTKEHLGYILAPLAVSPSHSILPEVMRCLKKAVIAGRSRSSPRAKRRNGSMPDSSTSPHQRLMRIAPERALVATA